MSFCSELKKELCNIKSGDCCLVSECYGFLLTSRKFSYNEITLTTANPYVADRYHKLLKSVFAVFPAVKQGKGEKAMTKITLKNEDSKRIMEAFGYLLSDNLTINRDVFKKDCCLGSFIRGAFLSCGQMSDPEKNYRAEFVIRDFFTALEFYKVLTERGLSPKRSIRGNVSVIYFNQSETVEELLTLMGAGSKIFEFMEVRMTKDFRNNLNRKTNGELGNISKQVESSIRQCHAVEKLRQSGKLELLDEELYKVALLREKYPNATLRELTLKLDIPLSRSGLNHRLAKITALAEECK